MKTIFFFVGIIGIVVGITLYLNVIASSNNSLRPEEDEIIEYRFHTPLNKFRMDNNRFPFTTEGLDSLIHCPNVLRKSWKGPYVSKIAKDSWGRDYEYRSPNSQLGYIIVSKGKSIEDFTDDVRFVLLMRSTTKSSADEVAAPPVKERE